MQRVGIFNLRLPLCTRINMDETALTDTASKLMIEGISQMVRIEYESVKFSTTRKANPSVEKKKKDTSPKIANAEQNIKFPILSPNNTGDVLEDLFFNCLSPLQGL